MTGGARLSPFMQAPYAPASMRLVPRIRSVLGAFALLTSLASVARTAPLDSLLARLPADDLAVPLRRLENEASRPRDGAQAAFMLGQLHYARGEYRRAAEAFSRAAARLDPARKSDARYWAAMSWLALGDHAQARSTFEELAGSAAPQRIEARFGSAVAWEQARRPERAYAILEPLAREARGEVGPAVLEHTLRLAEQFQQAGVIRLARQRLLEDYPRSIEAARIGLKAGPFRAALPAVELGPFPTEPEAHATAERARAAGFSDPHPVTRGASGALVYVVRLGTFPNASAAKAAADRARRELRVQARVVAAP